MKASKKEQKLLAQMTEIRQMERGKVCQMKGRDHFNHQTWQAGRNEVRYVHPDEVQELQQAINGYNRFMKLAQQYADEIIRRSRREREKKVKKRKKTAMSAKKSEKIGV